MPPHLALSTVPLPVRLLLLGRAVLALLGRLLAPPTCAACDAVAPSQQVFCPACKPTVRREAVAREADVLSVERVIPDFAWGLDAGALSKAIRRLKYGARPDLAGPLASLLRDVIVRAGIQADLVIPVPLHPRKLRDRGYNQSALLASSIARDAGARFAPRALVRTRDTTAQASLDRAARATNIEGAFRARDPLRIQGRRVLLIDDIATTGATLRACAAALTTAGAARVTTLVLARRP